MNLEEFLLTEERWADDKYVTNGACLISKEYLNSIVFKIAKNEENIFEKCKETVPLEKGKGEPILKFFVGEKFVGCLMSMRNR